ncbi:hypothetical protein SAMN02787144_102846 [Streptomyces atratus]|uniref:Uncharacterized protein n=1 Tax=Streptomyces atratus TaxID=1893 RepID=A0A1K2F1G5_STRAR|nr:hypothetical protein SAMN02787144_102846 [Streptomyces atratus]
MAHVGQRRHRRVALKKIDVVGYAVWAGIGAIGAAVLGPVFRLTRIPCAGQPIVLAARHTDSGLEGHRGSR